MWVNLSSKWLARERQREREEMDRRRKREKSGFDRETWAEPREDRDAGATPVLAGNTSPQTSLRDSIYVSAKNK